MSGPTRWLVAVGGVILLALVGSAAVALLGSDEQEFPEGSPERTVQQYLRAVNERDSSGAMAFLSTELRERCEDTPKGMITQRGDSDLRAVLERTRPLDSRVEVRVTITETYGDPPFGGGESSHPVDFVLAQEGGQWRFVEQPWPLFCPPRPIATAPGPTVTATPPPPPPLNARPSSLAGAKVQAAS